MWPKAQRSSILQRQYRRNKTSLREQFVTDIRRIYIRKYNKEIETNIQILTVEYLNIPKQIILGTLWSRLNPTYQTPLGALSINALGNRYAGNAANEIQTIQ